MKKTQFIELFKNIKKTFVSFFSITIFIALATALFLGINWSATAFSRVVDKTVNDGDMQNIEIVYPYGFSEDFVKEINNAKDVSFAEGYYSAEELFRYDDYIYQARVISLTDKVNIPTAIEGTLPQKIGEIAVQKFFADNHNIKIGDEIVFEHNDDGSAYILSNLLKEDIDSLKDNKPTADGVKELLTDSFKVTALIETPQYINQYNVTYGISQITSVPNDCIMYVNKVSFDENAFAGYPYVAVRNKSLDKYVSLTDEYNKKSDEFIDEIQPLATAYTDKRNNEVLEAIKNIENSITSDINEGETQYEDAKKVLDDSETKLNDSIKKLQELKNLLDESQAKIKAGWEEANKNQALIDENEERLKIIQKSYDITDKILDILINYRIDIKDAVIELHDYRVFYGKLLEYSLPKDEYLTLQLLDTLFEKINSGEYDDNIKELAEDLGPIIDAIANSEEYAKLDDFIADLKAKGESKYEIKLIIDALDYLDKEYTDEEIEEIFENKDTLSLTLSSVSTLYDQYDSVIKLYIISKYPDFDVSKFEYFDDIIDVIDIFGTDLVAIDNVADFKVRFAQFQNDLKGATLYDDFVNYLTLFYNDEEAVLEDSIYLKIAEELQSFKKGFDAIAQVSDSLFDLYKMLQAFGAIESLENEIYETIENKLIEGEYENARQIIHKINAALDENYKSFDEIAPILDEITTNLNEGLAEAKQAMVDNKHLLNEAWEKLNDAKSELNEAINKLIDAQKEVDDGLIEYRNSLSTLNAKQKEFDDATVELDEGKQKLDDGKKLLLDYQDMTREIEAYDNSILGRNTNAAIASTLGPLKIMSKVKYTLSVLFVIVGLFVCYSAISRIIFEDTKLIGTKKALGLSKRSITISYLLYALLATILGTLIGNILAVFLVEPIISSAMSANFILTNNQFYFNLKDSVLFFLFELVTSLLFAYLACRATLNKRTIDLLTGNSELSIKTRFFEKWNLWKKLPLFTKTVVINFFNDKKRVFATIVGITGCCSLLVCAMLLFFNLYGTFDYQMENITKYDTIIYLDTTKDNALENVKEILDDNKIDNASAYFSNVYLKKQDGSISSTSVYSYDDNSFRNFFGITKNGKEIDELTDGIWLNTVYAETNNIKVGDTINIIDVRGNEKSIVVGGTYDYYLLKIQGLMNSKTYEETFNTDYADNILMFNRDNRTIKQLFSMFDGVKGFSSAYDIDKEANQLYDALIGVLIIIVITYTVISFVLAFIVLLNLYTMFVSEKKMELLVMMINGYSRKDAKKYIYQDSIFLTIIGIIAGSILGIATGLLTIKALNVDYVAILNKINVGTFVIAGLVTAILSTINCFIAMKKISKFELTNVNAQR